MWVGKGVWAFELCGLVLVQTFYQYDHGANAIFFFCAPALSAAPTFLLSSFLFLAFPHSRHNNRIRTTYIIGFLSEIHQVLALGKHKFTQAIHKTQAAIPPQAKEKLRTTPHTQTARLPNENQNRKRKQSSHLLPSRFHFLI